MSDQQDLKDLFLSEELLIELAKRELKGKRPPSLRQQNSMQPNTSAVQTKLQRELESRGWTYRDLAMTVGIPAGEAQAIARGGQRVTRELAEKLARVFATSADYWLRSED
ncbi:MAG: hypothetical protein RLZZ488_2442 [Pseudomonadota bacterium]|jgi:plasmid maintenance system antidote protein VapI